jgi:8-oxo-dGTP diphosphatase
MSNSLTVTMSSSFSTQPSSIAARSPTPIAIAVVQHDDRFLIGQRPEGVPLAGYWEFPGGKVEASESPEDAARRECLEETGLNVEICEAYPQVVHQYDHDKVRLYFFQAKPLDPSAKPQSPFRWVTRRELANYIFPPANAGLMQHLLAELRDLHE